MKHVLFYITYYPGYGGIEKVTTFLANHLCKHNLKVTILSFQNNARELQQQLAEDVQLLFMPDAQNFLSDANQEFLDGLSEKYAFDFIVYQDCYSDIHELLFHAKTDMRDGLIVCEHNSPTCQLIAYRNYWKRLSWLKPHDFFRKLYYPIKRRSIYNAISRRHKLLLENSRTYVVLSESLKKEIHYLVGHCYDHKLWAISNPITIRPSASFAENGKTKQVLFVGRLVEDKGIPYLLDVWTAFENQAKDWHLVIVGDGPMRSVIERTIRERHLQRVQLEGARANVEDYYKDSSLLLMTSVFEGFPLVLFEAMSMGVVPIAFNSFAALQDIIDDAENGYRISPYDLHAYVDALVCLTSDEALLGKMRKSALAKSQKFNIETIGKRWIELIQ